MSNLNTPQTSFTWAEVGILAQAALCAQTTRLREQLGVQNKPLNPDSILSRALHDKPPGRYLVAKVGGRIWCKAQDEWPNTKIRQGAEYWAYVRIRKDLTVMVLGESK